MFKTSRLSHVFLYAILLGWLSLTLAAPWMVAAGTFSVAFVRKWGAPGTGDGQFNATHAVGLGKDGKVYVADEANHRIQYFSSEGTFLGKWGGYGSQNGELISPASVASSPDGTLIYIVERDNHRVQYFSPTGAFLGKWGSQGSGNGAFQSPGGGGGARFGWARLCGRSQ